MKHVVNCNKKCKLRREASQMGFLLHTFKCYNPEPTFNLLHWSYFISANGEKRKKTKPIKFKWDPPAPPLPSPVSSVSLLKLGTFAEATMLNTNNTPFSQSSPNLTSSGRLCPFIVPGAYVWMVKKAGQKQLGAGAGIPPGGVLMLFYNNLSAAWRPPDTMAVAVFECLSVFMVGGLMSVACLQQGGVLPFPTTLMTQGTPPILTCDLLLVSHKKYLKWEQWTGMRRETSHMSNVNNSHKCDCPPGT